MDVLVNNAGGCAVIRATEEITEEEWDAIVASNLTSVFLCSKAVLPIMKRQRYGRIVILASVVGRAGAVSVTSHYAAAEAIRVRRLGEPGEIAEAVVFLASDSAAFINSSTLDVNRPGHGVSA